MNVDRLRGPAAAGLALLLLAWGLAAGRGSLLPRADFAFCNQQEISSLDPAIATGVPEARVLGALFEGLTRLHPQTSQPLPGMAERWEVSADGLQWRFFLRENSRWTNGEPVSAHDFAFSLRRLLDPATAAPYAPLLYVLEGAEAFNAGQGSELGVEAVGERELLLRLRHPCPLLPQLLALPPCLPVNRHAGLDPDHLVSNGPFFLAERRVRDRLRLARFDGYWGRAEVALATIDAYAADSPTTQLNLYLTGEVDWMVRPPSGLYGQLLGRPDAHVGPQFGMTFLRFNTTQAPFADGRVRRALLLALDRAALARDVLRGGELPARAFVPGGEAQLLAPSDPEAGRALLTEAGFPGGAGFPPFELLYPHNEVTRDFCAAVAEQWKRELGLSVHLVNQTWKVYLDSCQQLQYEVSWGTWIADYLDPLAFLEIFESQSGNNRTGWTDPAYDALLGRARAEPDEALRRAFLGRAEALLLESLPIAPVYQRVNVNLVAPRVSGFFDNLLDSHPLRDLATP